MSLLHEASPETAAARPLSHGRPDPLSEPARGWLDTKLALLILSQAIALGFMGAAVVESRRGSSLGLIFFWVTLVVISAPSAAYLLQRGPSRRQRFVAVLLLGLIPTLVYRMVDPLLLSGYDEQLHLRTLVDIANGHSPLLPHPLLAVSPEYPGLEAFTTLLRDFTSLPLLAAATVVVLICRIVFVAVLFVTTERISGSARVAGLCVVIYSTCQQYYFFNAQFAYQTLAIVLSLAGVSLIYRAAQTHGRDATLLTWAAAACLSSMAFTHHITSWLTSIFLGLWALAEREPARKRVVRRGALISIGAVVFWALVNFGSLYSYFEPLVASTADQIDGFVRGSSQHVLFKDGSGVQSPVWQQDALILYAGLVSLLSLVVGVRELVGAYRGRNFKKLLVGILGLLFPVTLAFRILPNASEFGDRSTTFLLIPLAYLAAVALEESRLARRFQATRLVSAGLMALISFGFVGGVLLGSGPDWERLPGKYLVAADNRSIDPPTLAMAAWAKAHLPLGTRIGADRIGGAVLAAEGRMWPVVLTENNVDPAELYFANGWGTQQVSEAQSLQLGYLYVDDRWSTELPHATVYFHDGETPEVQKLSAAELSKFASIPGVKVAHRIGPVVIYDIRAVTGDAGISGYTATQNQPPIWLESGIGLLAGLILGALLGTPLGLRTRASLRRYYQLAGLELATASILAVGTLAGIAFAFSGLAFGGYVTIAVAVGLLPLLARSGRLRLPRRSGRKASAGLVSTLLVGLSVALAAGALTASYVSAWHVDRTEVRHLESAANAK